MSEGLGFVLSHPKRPTTPRTRTCPWGPRAARLGWGTRTAAAHVQDAYDAIGCAVWPSSQSSHNRNAFHRGFRSYCGKSGKDHTNRGDNHRLSSCPELHSGDLENAAAPQVTWPKLHCVDSHFSEHNYGYYCFISISSPTLLTPNRSSLRTVPIASARKRQTRC